MDGRKEKGGFERGRGKDGEQTEEEGEMQSILCKMYVPGMCQVNLT